MKRNISIGMVVVSFLLWGCKKQAKVEDPLNFSAGALPQMAYPDRVSLVAGLDQGSIVPINSGGGVVSCSISPSLPTGLSLKTLNCALTGIPSAVSALQTYTITARNAVGTHSVDVRLEVKSAAPDIHYANGPHAFTMLMPITPLSVVNEGSTIRSNGCSVFPALPSGLSLNANTCKITGIPTAPSASNVYTITAQNLYGSSSTNLSIAVNNILPSISFLGGPFILGLNSIISPILASNSGGAIDTGGCLIMPALPAGLSLNPDTCAITGAPIVLSGVTSYVVQATNGLGSTSAAFDMGVANIAPIISYATSTLSYLVGTLISPLNVSSTGGAIAQGGCSIAPALPPGLSLNSDTCQITGTPTALAVSPSTPYTVTATNSVGSGTAVLNLAVNNVAPIISYAVGALPLSLNSLISPLSITNIGGLIQTGGCSVSPALPAGLSLDADTCAITGIPAVLTPLTRYTVSATNGAGTSSSVIDIAVINLAPVISYGAGVRSFSVGSLISALLPSNSGGAIQSGGCSVLPALPAGLSLNADTCAITGIPVPAGISGATNYTVTAMNSAGSGNAPLNISILNVAPNISYAGNIFTLLLGSLISNLTITNTGGAINPGGCSVSPSLPLGLSINTSTCAISGLPLLTLLGTTFTVTASNAMGSDTTNVSITIVP